MAETPEAVERFLAEVKAAVDEAERRDLDELRALKAARAAPVAGRRRRPRAGTCRSSASGCAKQRYSVDQESLRQYFPPRPDARLAARRRAASLYGLRFDAGARAGLARRRASTTTCIDAETGAFIGGIYFDLYPREGKFPHAAAWPVRGVSRAAGRTPISVLVANFDRRGLTHDEVETLFHEFGHILHGVLSETDVQLPRRHERAARLRRGAVADLRGVDATPRKPRAHARCVARHAGDGCRPRRAARRRAALRSGPAATRASGSTRRSTWRSPARRRGARWRCGSAWKAAPSSATCRGTAFPGTFGHIVGGYAAGLLRLHVGRGASRSTCCRPSATTS